MRPQLSSVVLLSGATATGAGAAHVPVNTLRTFQAQGATSAGAGAATILIEVSNIAGPGPGDRPDSDTDWSTLDTLSLTLGTTATTDFGESNAAWRFVRARVTAISGTDATVSVYMGV